MCVQGVINSKFSKKNEWMRSIESFKKSYRAGDAESEYRAMAETAREMVWL